MDHLDSIPSVEILTSLALGVIASTAAAVVFLRAMLKLRPQIEISDQIARTIMDGRTEYQIKVINRASRSSVNLQAELEIETSSNVPGGQVYDCEKIPLTKELIFEISGFRKNDRDATYAYRFCSREDIDRIWKEESKQRLTFRLHASDSVSGFGRMANKTYFYKKKDIVDGDFAFGDSMEIT